MSSVDAGMWCSINTFTFSTMDHMIITTNRSATHAHWRVTLERVFVVTLIRLRNSSNYATRYGIVIATFSSWLSDNCQQGKVEIWASQLLVPKVRLLENLRYNYSRLMATFIEIVKRFGASQKKQNSKSGNECQLKNVWSETCQQRLNYHLLQSFSKLNKYSVRLCSRSRLGNWWHCKASISQRRD